MTTSATTARERLEIMIRTDAGSMTVWHPAEVRAALDAYRTAVLTEAETRLRDQASELSEAAEEELRRDLEEQAQLWHNAADMVSRVAKG